jgi:hypothetical protein
MSRYDDEPSQAHLESAAEEQEQAERAGEILVPLRELRAALEEKRAARAELVRMQEPVGWLVASALHGLWSKTEDEDLGGCCWHHCGPCGALKTLLDAGHLDDLVPRVERHGGNAIWDEAREQVWRGWLVPALTALCERGIACDGCGDCDHAPDPRGVRGVAR